MKYTVKILSLILLILVACESGRETTDYFPYGIASGDPTHTSMIIWTKVMPHQADEPYVLYEIATDSLFEQVIQNDTILIDAAGDYTAKRVVYDLEPGNSYYYRFLYQNSYSPIGRMSTPAFSPDTIRLAVVSCSNYEAGYFNVYRHIGNRNDLDAVLHLGDYIYEYGAKVYGDTTLGRTHEPPHEIISLDDYRTRYAQYHRDPDLKLARARHPFITIWDDHETANNSYVSGAQNHQEDEGDYELRKQASKQAYEEWLPVTEGLHFRNIPFGRLAHLIMLDGRLQGRTEQLYDGDSASLYQPNRSMLGKGQVEWFKQELKNKAIWKVVGNPVLFSYHENVHYAPDQPLNRDAWDGYPAEKEDIIHFIDSADLRNIVFVTGDTHMSWAFEVLANREAKGKYLNGDTTQVHAVEFGTPSVTSKSSGEYFDTEEEMLAKQELLLQEEFNPHLKYANLKDHGYIMLKITANYVEANYYYVPTIKEKTGEAILKKTVRVLRNENTLQ